MFQSVLDVIRRPTAKLSVGITPFVQLPQAAFKEAGGHTYQGCDPHPEHRARAAQCDRQPDTGDIARAYAPRQAQHQRLERADLAGTLLHAIAKRAEHMQKMAELDKA
ncbi:hypothetical protein D3C85_1162540 [compost metagenome]